MSPMLIPKRKKPSDSRFIQQDLPACRPILTPGWVITSFFLVSVICIPMGIAFLLASRSVVEIVHRYDLECIPGNFSNNPVEFIQSSHTNKTCLQILTVPQHMKSPVYVYYELHNFYQNHHRYADSVNVKQLISNEYTNKTKKCYPETGDPNHSIVPCGFIAWSLFNDTFGLSINNTALEVNKTHIAWKSDRERKFGSDVYPQNFQTGSVVGGGKLDSSKPFSEQEDLMVWMRIAALPTFRKLYGRIERGLKAQDVITVVIMNNYNTYSSRGQKKLVLSTTSWIGGKNDFTGIAFLTVGGLYLLIGLFFIVLAIFKPRPIGDPAFLSWNKNPTGSGGSGKKMAEMKATASAGLDKVNAAAVVGAQKVKSGTSVGIKWMKNQYQKKTSSSK